MAKKTWSKSKYIRSNNPFMWRSVPPSIRNPLAIAGKKKRIKYENKSVGLQRRKCQTLEQTMKKERKEQRWMDKENITSMKSKMNFLYQKRLALAMLDLEQKHMMKRKGVCNNLEIKCNPFPASWKSK
jgi:hypothetical protein